MNKKVNNGGDCLILGAGSIAMGGEHTFPSFRLGEQEVPDTS